MKKIIKKLGIWPVYAGVLLLMCGYLSGWTDHNWFLVLPIVLMGLGICGYVTSAASHASGPEGARSDLDGKENPRETRA